eukprot:PhM_4_TR8407/c4_g3_i1/m.59051
MDCLGCQDFSCLENFFCIGVCVGTDADALQWLKGHRLGEVRSGPSRNQLYPADGRQRLLEISEARLPPPLSELAPLLNSYNRMSPKAVLTVLYCHIEGTQNS